jgi:hypothetical protein
MSKQMMQTRLWLLLLFGVCFVYLHGILHKEHATIYFAIKQECQGRNAAWCHYKIRKETLDVRVIPEIGTVNGVLRNSGVSESEIPLVARNCVMIDISEFICEGTIAALPFGALRMVNGVLLSGNDEWVGLSELSEMGVQLFQALSAPSYFRPDSASFKLVTILCLIVILCLTLAALAILEFGRDMFSALGLTRR